MTTRRTFTLPSGRKVTTRSPRRFVLIDDRDGEIVLRTDSADRARRLAREHRFLCVFNDRGENVTFAFR